MATRYGLVIDLERCIGCQACTIACKVQNNTDSVSGIRVETVGGPHQDTPGGTFPNLVMHYLPVPCMHCSQPPCLDACPTGALFKRSDGIVLLDETKCDGCLECSDACPYEALKRNPDNSMVHKCNLCFDRLDEGFEPFCALCCGVEAIYWGDVENPESRVSQLISERNAYALKPEAGTGPGIRYCPPKEPRKN